MPLNAVLFCIPSIVSIVFVVLIYCFFEIKSLKERVNLFEKSQEELLSVTRELVSCAKELLVNLNGR